MLLSAEMLERFPPHLELRQKGVGKPQTRDRVWQRPKTSQHRAEQREKVPEWERASPYANTKRENRLPWNQT